MGKAKPSDTMRGESPRCPVCENPLPREELAQGLIGECPVCQRTLTARVYPAFQQTVDPVQTGRRKTFEDESSCFFHPSKQAQTVCQSCGRYVCGLCETVFENQVLCPDCLGSAHDDQSMTTLVNRRVCHDSIALMISVVPILMWPLTVLTAPAAIIYAGRYWNAEGSLVRRGKVRFILAILFALLQIVGWVFLFIEISKS